MKRIYTSQSHVLVILLRDALTGTGVRCFIKNELLAGAAGELPLTECWPELWITDDDQCEWANAIVMTTLNSANRRWPTWQCAHCGQMLEGQFAQCWQCGHVRESVA
jgi:hypothetical protein